MSLGWKESSTSARNPCKHGKTEHKTENRKVFDVLAVSRLCQPTIESPKRWSLLAASGRNKFYNYVHKFPYKLFFTSDIETINLRMFSLSCLFTSHLKNNLVFSHKPGIFVLTFIGFISVNKHFQLSTTSHNTDTMSTDAHKSAQKTNPTSTHWSSYFAQLKL